MRCEFMICKEIILENGTLLPVRLDGMAAAWQHGAPDDATLSGQALGKSTHRQRHARWLKQAEPSSGPPAPRRGEFST